MFDEPIFTPDIEAPETKTGSLAEQILDGLKSTDNSRSRVDFFRRAVEKEIKKQGEVDLRDLALDILEAQKEEFFLRRLGVLDAALVAAELLQWAAERKKKAARIASVPTAAQVETETAPRSRSTAPRRSAFSGGTTRRQAPAPAPQTAAARTREEALEDVEAIINSPRFLTLPVSENIRSAVERTVHYLRIPGDRPVAGVYREQKLKKDLSARSAKDYARTKKQITEELKELGAATTWDRIAYLVSAAQSLEVSGYKRLRAGLLRMAAEDGDALLTRAIRSMPHYGELCTHIKKTPSKRSTPVTEARRAAQDEKRFLRLLARLSPVYADAICVMRYTGARAVETSSVRLEVKDGAVQVSVRNAKMGARKRKKNEILRNWSIPLPTPEGQLLAAIAARRGEEPCKGLTSEGLRAAWARARRWEGVESDAGWSLHSLRHQYARDFKRQAYARMKEVHGADWRQKLFGPGWLGSKEYADAVYGPLAAQLGHTSTTMAKTYG